MGASGRIDLEYKNGVCITSRYTSSSFSCNLVPFNTASTSGEVPVVVVSSAVRDSMYAIVERIRPTVSVLSQSEVYPRARIKTVATVT